MSHTPKDGLKALAAATLLAITGAVYAATPEQLCQFGRANAAAKYASCEQQTVAKAYLAGNFDPYARAAAKCVTKYAATWPKLVAKGAGSTTCVNPRYVDSGNGIITDQLTALEWEKKTNLDSTSNFADAHDADNEYTWSAGIGTAADGTAFTSFLVSLNSGGCLAGQCDWRLPTRDELLTLTSPGYPVCATPCIDPAFGPVVADDYWSASMASDIPFEAWYVNFYYGGVYFGSKSSGKYVRGVRSGL